MSAVRRLWGPGVRSTLGLVAFWGAGCGGAASGDVADDTGPRSTGTPLPGDTAPAVDPLAWDVGAPGPFQVGFRTWSHTYQPAVGPERTIGVNVWYPTEATEGEELSYAGLAPAAQTLGEARPAAAVHADGYPVLAYTHGDQGFGGTSAFLMRHVASHGWVAVAPDHTDNILFRNVEPTPKLHWLHRPSDVVAALAAVASDEALGPALDDTRYLFAGHSRGGSTVWSLAGAAFDADPASWCPGCTAAERAAFDDLADPRVAAFVTLAAGLRSSLFGDAAPEADDGPWLALSGTADAHDAEGAWQDLQDKDALWASLEGGCHQTFALGGCATLDDELGFSIVNRYVLGLGRAVLLGDDDPTIQGWLAGTAVPDPAVTAVRATP